MANRLRQRRSSGCKLRLTMFMVKPPVMFKTQAGIHRCAGMRTSLCVMLATFLPLANDAWAGDAPLRPEIRVLRQDENWSALRDPKLRSNLFDRLKLIPL